MTTMLGRKKATEAPAQEIEVGNTGTLTVSGGPEGFTQLDWDTTDPASVKAVKAAIAKAQGASMLGVITKTNGEHEAVQGKVKLDDPEVAAITFTSQIVGG